MVLPGDENTLLTNYIVNATGIQIIRTKLRGVIPVSPMERIEFFSVWVIIYKHTEHVIPSGEVMKVAKLAKKKRHYYWLQSITRVYEPKNAPNWKQIAYYILLGREKDDRVIGYLLYLVNTSYVMGIWPERNAVPYIEAGPDKRQALFLSELKKFQNPKLWKEVYFLTTPL